MFLTKAWIQDAACHDEFANGALVDDALDTMLMLDPRPMSDVKTVLMLDSDNTLAPYDASTLYWRVVGENNPLKALFKSALGYSYTAFRQMSWLYQQHVMIGGDRYLDDMNAVAASGITLHPRILDLLEKAYADKIVEVVIVTCGMKLIWEKVLERLNMDTVPIIGNGLLNGIVITPKIKADIVARLKHHYKL
jgi:phosphoserine phosphatase